MKTNILVILACTIIAVSAWSPPHPQHTPKTSATKFAPAYRQPIQSPEPSAEEAAWSRAKRDHHHDDYSQNHRDHSSGGVTGPIHTFVKTDKNANYKWGVRHHVGPKYV